MGQPYGNSVDWWSLGIVIYELFSGEVNYKKKKKLNLFIKESF